MTETPFPATTATERADRIAIEHPYVLAAASFDHRGEFAIAVVPELYACAVEIREHLWQAMGADAPTLVALVDELPDGDEALSDAVSVLDDGVLSRYVEAGGETERLLQRIVAECVEADRVGVLDDFIDLGGDSLSVVKVSALIRARLGADLSLEAVFDASTVRDLALLVEQAKRG
ncbi:phosphopantetheine-binding protein [Nonomuraea zeae]|uniref:Carrier domain-containing protein n=1 Tax=Nonomuraea zeae TaxID=1642303 RepID=A0A5S4G4V2_9ACTN|nr:phosphopantetheine-binding protein [Nonomuraea zeae]TMR28018.1 hypothetical protein ETD85_37295 [Nonomuraea zeae]